MVATCRLSQNGYGAFSCPFLTRRRRTLENEAPEHETPGQNKKGRSSYTETSLRRPLRATSRRSAHTHAHRISRVGTQKSFQQRRRGRAAAHRRTPSTYILPNWLLTDNDPRIIEGRHLRSAKGFREGGYPHTDKHFPGAWPCYSRCGVLPL